MLLPIVIAFTGVGAVIDTPPDKQALTRLEKGLGTLSDKKAWFIRFEKQCPASETSVWQRLQQKVAPNSKQYGELSFALAYYGVDYKANLLRITRPYHLYKQNFTAYKKEYGTTDWEGQWTGWGETWFALNLLYLKHHDTKSLAAWLDQYLDGAPAESSDGELGDLWKRHKADMLRAAIGSEQRFTNLASSLTFGYVCSGNLEIDRRGEHNLLAEIAALRQSDVPTVSFSAHKLYNKVKALADAEIRSETNNRGTASQRQP